MRGSFVFPLGFLLLLGCGGGSANEYSGPYGQATGVVRLDGKPLTETASLTFLSGDGFAVTGAVNESGEFRLKYNGSSDIPVGKYNVGITSNVSAAPVSQNPADFFNADGSTKVVEIKSTKIPAKYGQPGSSGLQIEIKEGSQELKVDLDS